MVAGNYMPRFLAVARPARRSPAAAIGERSGRRALCGRRTWKLSELAWSFGHELGLHASLFDPILGPRRPGARAQSRESSRRRDHMATHKVVKHEEWLTARKKHLTKEKEFTRMRDQLSRERRELPWELVDKQYTFQGGRGAEPLSGGIEE